MLPVLALAAALAADTAAAVPAATAAPATIAAVAAAPPRLSGYVQVRSVYQTHAGITNSLNRARLGADGALPQHVSYRVLVEYESAVSGAAATVALRDAYMKWTHGPLAVTAGQFKTPFSRDYVTSLTVIETADRPSVVDSLAPKRDIGAMLQYDHPWASAYVGLFNGEGQNVGTNRDSVNLLVSRVLAHPLPGVDLGASGAWNGRRTQRYGLEASAEWRGATLRGEWIGQRRPGAKPDDQGWFALAAYRVLPWLQPKLQQEDFLRPALGARRRMGATTAGVNLDLPGGRNRIILEYVGRRTGSPFVTRDQALAQWQVRF